MKLKTIRSLVRTTAKVGVVVIVGQAVIKTAALDTVMKGIKRND